MLKFTNIWDVTPETAHPLAKQLIGQSIVWNYGDEDSPLGNDTGADTFAEYLNFRTNQPDGNIVVFINKKLRGLRIGDTDWDLLDVDRVNELLRTNDGVNFLRRDDFIIGLAFAQLLLDGTIHQVVLWRALIALHRQGLDVVLLFRGGGGLEARKSQLAGFRRILESVQT